MSKIGLYKNTQESPIKIIHIEYLWIPCIKENPHMYAKCMVNELPLIWILHPKILEGLTNLRSSHSLAKPEAISGFHETPGMYTWTMEIGTTADCSVFHDSFHRFEIGRSCLQLSVHLPWLVGVRLNQKLLQPEAACQCEKGQMSAGAVQPSGLNLKEKNHAKLTRPK